MSVSAEGFGLWKQEDFLGCAVLYTLKALQRFLEMLKNKGRSLFSSASEQVGLSILTNHACPETEAYFV